MAIDLHTQAPWERGEENESRTDVLAEGRVIARVNRGLLVGRKEAEANLALILSAPVLLGELKALAEIAHNHFTVPDSVWETIAKATGEKQ